MYSSIAHTIQILTTGWLRKNTQHKNGDIYVAGEYFLCQILLVYSAYIFSQLCLILLQLTFIEVMKHQGQCSIFANQQLNVSDFAQISNTEKQML